MVIRAVYLLTESVNKKIEHNEQHLVDVKVTMKIVAFLCILPALVASQSLVLVGGGLSDDNADVWNEGDPFHSNKFVKN